MRLFGLIGFPLSHSFSVSYFKNKFEKENIADAQYANFPIENIDLLRSVIENNPNLAGLNVTIPYKQEVLPYLSELSVGAKTIGAVNTIKILRSGNRVSLKGYNTDEYGFRNALQPNLKEMHRRALVLGSGGASKAVTYVLDQLGIAYVMVSRKPNGKNYLSYTDITKEVIQNHLIIINTTPLGMFPEIAAMPEIPYEYLGANHILFDLIYNPATTAFMQKGIEKGASVVNGLQMLHLQAERAWQIWNDGAI